MASPKEIAKLLNHYQALLNLSDWIITYDPTKKPDETNQAQMLIGDTKDEAILVCGDMEDPEFIVVHELLHVHLIRLENFITTIVSTHVHDNEVKSVYGETLDNLIEIVVNNLARVIVGLERG